MTIILKEMIDKETGCELHKSDDGFYVIVYNECGSSVQRYSDMNEHGLLAAIATYQLELSYLWTAKHDAQDDV